jgi:hypothetical protein
MRLQTSVAVFVVLAATAGASMAQQPYPASDSRSPQYLEYQRQQQEQQRDKDKVDKQRKEEDSAQSAQSMQTFMENQRRLQEKLSGDVERDRAMFLQTPVLQSERNGLLGRWKLDTTKKRPTNAVAELNAMISQPACEMVFGDGLWDFRPKALWTNDPGFGEQMMTELDYRGYEGIVGVVPKTFMRLLIFKILGPDRVQELTSTRIGADPCTFVRVGAGTQSAGAAPAAGARSANATPSHESAAVNTGAPAAPPVQLATAAPTRSTPSRPSPEVCRQTLLDKLGTVGVNQVRAMSDVRFKEPAIEGKEPNTGNMRIDLRGSACDDPRIKATLYDFDAGGMLQSITYVWERPSGPAPAPIFHERVKTLSLHHALPPPQSPGRLQADTSLGRLVLQDMPERNLLLEAYAAKK